MDAAASTSLSQGAVQQSTQTHTGLITVITLGVLVVLTRNAGQGDVCVQLNPTLSLWECLQAPFQIRIGVVGSLLV